MSREPSAVVLTLLETAARLLLVAVVIVALALRLAIFAAVRVATAVSGPWHYRTQPRRETAIGVGL